MALTIVVVRSYQNASIGTAVISESTGPSKGRGGAERRSALKAAEGHVH